MSNSKANARAEKVAAERAAQAKREARRRLLTIVGVIAVMAVIIGGSIGFSVWKRGKDQTAIEQAVAAAASYGVKIGPASAQHKVIIYEDFICPYCGQLEASTRDDLTKLAGEGKVQVEYRPFDLLSGNVGDYPIRAASAFSVVLEKSGPEVAKKFHDLLYENQPAEDKGDSVTNADLLALAVKAGATESDVADGITNVSNRDWVTKATAEADKANVHGTPTVLVDGRLLNNPMTELLPAIK